MLRYFCVVAPGVAGDVGYGYMTAIAATGARIRALPIGPAAALGFEKRWWAAGHLFTVPLTPPFVNVVCAPIGMAMGMRAPAGALATKDDLPSDLPPDVREFMLRGAAKAAADSGPAVYEPQTVFSGLYTVGCKNIAIVDRLEGDFVVVGERTGRVPDARERAALGRYDRVICSKAADAVVLNGYGIDRVTTIAAGDIDLVRLEEICGCEFDISATTAGSPATPAPPATTSSRSTTPATSSSRSPSSATSSPVPSLAIRPWTPWRLGSISAWASRTWRSITRRLAFWRR
jgi:hypothetical protein